MFENLGIIRHITTTEMIFSNVFIFGVGYSTNSTAKTGIRAGLPLEINF
jgi:hypothetical protein